MAATPPGPRGDAQRDRHGWNTYENFQHVHEAQLEGHPFLDPDRPHTLAFREVRFEGEFFVHLTGMVYCLRGVILEVDQWFQTRRLADGRLQVRPFSFRYNASIRGRHNVLRYDNGHSLNEYHRHSFDLATGRERPRELLSRSEFPLLVQVLDELESLLSRHSEGSQ